MGLTHGPLVLQRLSDLTIGSEGLVISLRGRLQPREDRGEDPPCACDFLTQIYKRVVVM